MYTKKTMEELGRISSDEIQNVEKHRITIVLDDIRSMHNVGSAFRTADAFLVEQIILCGFTPQPPHREIQKTALGATDTVQWAHYTDTITAVKELKAKGYTIIAIEQVHDSVSLSKFQWDNQQYVALVFGNEVGGVNDEVLQISDHCIEIPQWGSKHSLNISVSLGIVLWELVRS